jgi:hypothetical protein
VRKITLFTLLALATIVGLEASPKVAQYRFNFKGFETRINDEAVDENGNHLLVGEISAIEMNEAKRDTAINRIFNLKGDLNNDDARGLMIATDKNYHILKIGWGYIGKQVVYDFNKKLFIIGAMKFDYIHVGEKSFSAWQPVIMQANLKLEGQDYFIVKPYSCILRNIALEGDEILVFTRSETNPSSEKSKEKAEVMRVSPAKCHRDPTRPWINAFDMIVDVETPYDELGDIHLSSISKVDGAYYFATSNLDQYDIKLKNHLYQFSNNQLTEIPKFVKYLDWKYDNSTFIQVNEFSTHAPNEYYVLSNRGGSNKEIQFSKTDQNFTPLLTKEIPLHDYADFHKMLVLSSGNIVLLLVNATKTWSYHLYDPSMELIQEIKSTVSEDYNPILLKETSEHSVECIFNVHHVDKKDCVLEVVGWD